MTKPNCCTYTAAASVAALGTLATESTARIAASRPLWPPGSGANRVWLDDALSAPVGSFHPATDRFTLSTLRNCNAHAYDRLALDAAPKIWFDEEFGSTIGERVP